MTDSLRSLIDTGTKLYLDSVEPSEVDRNLAWGAVGATSNPAIISGIVSAGGMDAQIESLLSAGHDDEAVAWALMAPHALPGTAPRHHPAHITLHSSRHGGVVERPRSKRA